MLSPSALWEDQKTDEFLEIDMGSDDILLQLECAMEKGTKLENNDKEDMITFRCSMRNLLSDNLLWYIGTSGRRILKK